MELYEELTTDNEDIFYFDTSSIKTYLGLEVTLGDIIVDFSTRYVYSIFGCQDPTYYDEIRYYTLSEIDGSTIIYEDETSSISSLEGVSVEYSIETSGSTSWINVTLTAERNDTGRYYPIKKAYYSTNEGTTYIEVDYLDEYEYTDDTVSFIIIIDSDSEELDENYDFMIEDTSGAKVSTTDDAG